MIVIGANVKPEFFCLNINVCPHLAFGRVELPLYDGSVVCAIMTGWYVSQSQLYLLHNVLVLPEPVIVCYSLIEVSQFTFAW